MQNVDLGQITDIKELKAMAYDQLAIKERADANLKAINTRLVEVAQAEHSKTAAPNAPVTDGTEQPENGSEATGEQDGSQDNTNS